jgi:hypothetical protein
MAGILVPKNDPGKVSVKTGVLSNEILSDSQSSPKTPQKLTLRGILGLNRPVEINPSAKSLWTKENLGISSISQQEQILLDNRQRELEKAIKELQGELAALLPATEALDKNLENAVLENIPEASEYQVSFLKRLKNLVVGFRKNLHQASVWLESFNTKKKKKNYFWSMARDKKKGGEAYMFSDEHSAARSVA